MFGNKVEFIQPDADPLQSPTKRKKRRPWLLIGLVAGGLACCVLSGFSLSQTFAQAAPATEAPPPTATLPAPGVQVTNPNSQIETALAPMSNALTPSATTTASATPIVLWSNTPTPGCDRPEHFLTELACNDLAMTATIESLSPGEVVNVSGIDPRVTIVYLFPSNTATAWIVTTTHTATYYPTYTPFPSHTFTPYPTYTKYPTLTPWVLLTAPPLVTVPVTVEVTREVTREITVIVVVTATPTETPMPTETPTEAPTP